MKIFKIKNYPDNTIETIENFLSLYDSKYHNLLLNGNYKYLSNWSLIQEILFFEKDLKKVFTRLIVKYNIDLNIRNKKGLSFYHLYLILLFYMDSFRTEERIDYFIEMLKFGVLPNHFMIINYNKIYSLLDILCLLQDEKKIIPKTVFPKYFNMKFSKLSVENFEKIYINLLFQKEKFYYLKKEIQLVKMTYYTVYDLSKLNDKLLNQYIIEKYNLPKNTVNLQQSILYLISNITDYNNSLKNETFPIGFDKDDTNYIYINPEFINNSELQISSFMNPIEGKYRFHKSFFSILIHTKMNPYTRKKIDEETLQNMIENINELIFPISTLDENISEFPFLFHKLNNEDNSIGNQNILSFIESFFTINHPYNQIYKLQNLKSYEIKYVSHVLTTETKLFPKFQESYSKNDIENLLRIFLFYCKSKIKCLNVIYYFLEEIQQDLKCFHSIEKDLDDFEKNYSKIYDNYTSRFNTSNYIYFSKFIKNIYLIRKFKNNSTENGATNIIL